MPARRDIAVRVEGLAEFRRDVRAMDKGLAKELRDKLKGAASIVLGAARAVTPRRADARLAGSLRVGTSGAKAFIRSPLPYANVIHWGGTTGRGHELGPGRGSVHIRGSFFITRPLEENQERVVDSIGDGIEQLAARHGWH